ncbi:hypothetical protein [Streptomyces cinerochromogenes]|uniref:hypothetical protein n=1 Tax=Streptomyces cinerochromogenes TaxID=66422 RepID=UPI0016702E32|nr:hypothetical protein [Streptomyces cinerochromogenes]GGS55215.1 hypothetical protein GCM10010206_16230 [Streptomyces cinerochromogenes]
MRLPRRRAPPVLLDVFVAGTIAAASAGGLGALAAARTPTTLTHSTTSAMAV